MHSPPVLKDWGSLQRPLDEVASNYIKQNRRKIARIQPLSAAYFAIYKKIPNLPLMKRFAIEIGRVFRDSIHNSYPEFKIDDVLPMLKKCLSKHEFKYVSSFYINYLEQDPSNATYIGDDYVKDIYDYIASHLNEFTSSYSSIIKSLKTIHLSSFFLLPFFKNNEAKLFVIKNDVLDAYINNFSSQPPKALMNENDYKLMTKLPIESLSIFELIVSGVNSHVTHTASQPYTEDRRWVIMYILHLFKKHYKYLNNSQNDNLINLVVSISSQLTTLYNTEQDIDLRTNIFRIAYIIWTIPNNTQKSIPEEQILRPFISNPALSDSFNSLSTDEKKHIITYFSSEVQQAVQNNIDSYNNLLSLLTDRIKENVALNLVTTETARTFLILKRDLKYKISDPANFIKSLLIHKINFGNAHKDEFYELAYKLKFSGSYEIALEILQNLEKDEQDLDPRAFKKHKDRVNTYIKTLKP